MWWRVKPRWSGLLGLVVLLTACSSLVVLDLVIGNGQPPTPAAAGVQGCPNGAVAIQQFAVSNDRGLMGDPKGGPPEHVVGHHLQLHLVVSPLVRSVRVSTSGGPLSPPEDLVTVNAQPDAHGVADLSLDLPGRPDRVTADVYLPDNLRQCVGQGLSGPFAVLLKLWVEP